MIKNSTRNIIQGTDNENVICKVIICFVFYKMLGYLWGRKIIGLAMTIS